VRVVTFLWSVYLFVALAWNHDNDVQVAEMLNEQIGTEKGQRRPNPIEKSTVGHEQIRGGGSSSFVPCPGDQ
jgi:hypothetical protein